LILYLEGDTQFVGISRRTILIKVKEEKNVKTKAKEETLVKEQQKNVKPKAEDGNERPNNIIMCNYYLNLFMY
tara:strand:- start:1303 stop:1521 length:219 start_codon:yes stop_codon:yes gene_type:complete